MSSQSFYTRNRGSSEPGQSPCQEQNSGHTTARHMSLSELPETAFFSTGSVDDLDLYQAHYSWAAASPSPQSPKRKNHDDADTVVDCKRPNLCEFPEAVFFSTTKHPSTTPRPSTAPSPSSAPQPSTLLPKSPQKMSQPNPVSSPTGSASSAHDTNPVFSPGQDVMLDIPSGNNILGHKELKTVTPPTGGRETLQAEHGQNIEAAMAGKYHESSHMSVPRTAVPDGHNIRDTAHEFHQPGQTSDTSLDPPHASNAPPLVFTKTALSPEEYQNEVSEPNTRISSTEYPATNDDMKKSSVIYQENGHGQSSFISQDAASKIASGQSTGITSAPTFHFNGTPPATHAPIPHPAPAPSASISPPVPASSSKPQIWDSAPAKISSASPSFVATTTPRVSQSASAKPSSATPKGKISGRVNPPGVGGQSPSRAPEVPIPASKSKKRRNRGRGGAGGHRSTSKEPTSNQGRSGNSGTAPAPVAPIAPAAPAAPAAASASVPAAEGNKPSHAAPNQSQANQPPNPPDIPFQIPPRPLTPHRNPAYPDIDLEPRTRPISLPQLVNEVKGIYVGLAMVESKCIEIDNEQSANKDPNNKLEPEQWQALMALHRTLLHEHHDFMLASQHPCASPALRRVAQKYAMPARMWRHGIHSFLELLRHRLPEAREHMISFIYTAYSIIALLYESVDAFRDTWVECLGDLSRYRMAIEDDNQRVRDTWTLVSRRWYSMASDHSPGTGRLYHHLAILARPSIVTQMYYYTKSLCVLIPFSSTHESIKTMLDPVLKGVPQRVSAAEVDYTRIHAILFYLTSTTKQQREALYLQNDAKNQGQQESQDQSPSKTQSSAQTAPTKSLTSGQQLKQLHEEFASDIKPTADRFMDSIGEHIASSRNDWVQKGTQMAIVNSCSLMGYGRTDSVLFKIFNNAITHIPLVQDDAAQAGELEASKGLADNAMAEFAEAQSFVERMDKAVFKRALVYKTCYGYIHARLTWTLSLARISTASMEHVERRFPWQDLVNVLNQMLLTCACFEKIQQDTVMKPRADPEEEQRKLLANIAIKKEEEDRNQERIFRQQQERIRLQEEREQQQEQQRKQEQQDAEKVEGEASEEEKNDKVEGSAMQIDPVEAAAPVDPPVSRPAPPAVALPPSHPRSMAPTPSSSARGADDETRPIPDDWALRGLVWTDSYYPKNWFGSTDAVDDDEKLLETASVAIARQDRILWAACRLATFEKWITYDAENHKFSVAAEFVTAPSPIVSAVLDQDDLDMQDALEVDLDAASPSTMASVVSVEIEMEDTEEQTKGKRAEVDDVPGLEEDDDSIVSNTEDDNNDPGDDNVSLTHMQRLANQKVAKFDREHPPVESSGGAGPVDPKGAKTLAEASGSATGKEKVAALSTANVNNLPVDGMTPEKSESPGRKSDEKSMEDVRAKELISRLSETRQ